MPRTDGLSIYRLGVKMGDGDDRRCIFFLQRVDEGFSFWPTRQEMAWKQHLFTDATQESHNFGSTSMDFLLLLSALPLDLLLNTSRILYIFRISII